MGETTTYNGIRSDLTNKLAQCLELARQLLDPSIYGYEDMKKGYGLKVYIAIQEAKDEV